MRDYSRLSADDKADLARLALAPGWRILRELVEKGIERQQAEWGREVWLGTASFNELEAAERRGFWKGAQTVLDTPLSADKRIVRDTRIEGNDG